jgi:hypothetical protein
MTKSDDFVTWLKANPAPDMHKLAAEYGSYTAIPPERHEQWDKEYADWLERYRARHKDT